ncbi:MAG: 4Fe-4S dicluster domain-containing protein [Dehalococcoidia bacterium]|nr:4Fe-4S dicluster domain-containing protein [Dehalococcoidia bacterium]
MPESWGMIVDLDKCTGCQACVVACQAENNIPINEEEHFNQRRAIQWIRVERYWEGEFPNVRARFIPLFCQHCADAPCEPVCPVYATYHNSEGLNVQIYNRCIGTRFCANGCPYHARFFNFWEPAWPESLKNQLNPDVTVRSRGIMEKCTFCIQRIRRTKRTAEQEIGNASAEAIMGDPVYERSISPACVNACPTETLVFGDLFDMLSAKREGERLPQPKNKAQEIVKRELDEGRGYRILEELGTHPSVIYLQKVDKEAQEASHG